MPRRQYTRGTNSTKLPRWSVPPERNTAEWISAYGKNPRLAVVNKIASDLSYVDGKLYEVDAYGEEREIKSHPFLDFWVSPNPMHEFTSNAIWKLQEIYLLLRAEDGRHAGGTLASADPLGDGDTVHGASIL